MTDKSYIGKGQVYLDGRAIGNVSELTFSINEDKKELQDYTSSGGGLYNSLRRISGVEMSMTVHDYSAENLSVSLFGTASAVTAAAVTDESIAAPADLASGDRLVKTANLIDTSVAPVVTSDPAGTTYTVDTDYTVTASGIVILSSGTITASAALLIDYTKKAVDVVQALTTSAQEFELVFDGLNEAQSGTPVSITVFRAKFGGAQGLSVIGDEFGAMQLTGDVLKDTTITGAGLSQYLGIKAA